MSLEKDGGEVWTLWTLKNHIWEKANGKEGSTGDTSPADMKNNIISIGNMAILGKMFCQSGCSFQFRLIDRFEDVLDIYDSFPGNQEAGGTPYNITYTFYREN